MTSPRKARAHERLVGVLAIGFCLGALTTTYIAWRRDALRAMLFGAAPAATAPAPPAAAGSAPSGPSGAPSGAAEVVQPEPVLEPVVPAPAAGAGAAPVPAAGTDLDMLQRKGLLMPIDGITRAALQPSFDQPRGASRHEAIDILARRHTPVRAVEDGVVAKLFTSVRGGITLYQFDPSGAYCYYYAHLERYADGLREGQPLRRGDLIGYVGTSGNAPAETPHLHFAIFRLKEPGRWWEGTPIDPYLVLH